MNTFNIQLKSGKYLSIPAEYYPRYEHIMTTKENQLSITPINRFEAFLKQFSTLFLTQLLQLFQFST